MPKGLPFGSRVPDERFTKPAGATSTPSMITVATETPSGMDKQVLAYRNILSSIKFLLLYFVTSRIFGEGGWRRKVRMYYVHLNQSEVDPDRRYVGFAIDLKLRAKTDNARVSQTAH